MKSFLAPLLASWQETHDVKTLRFENTALLKFVPGQYCLLSFPENPTVEKPFTFSSSPTQKGFLDITIKAMGNFTKALHLAKVGDTIKIKGPLGEDMILEESVEDDLVFLTGGSGITPFMSMIRFWAEHQGKNKIVVLYGNRTKNDIIYEKELQSLVSTHPGIQVVHVLENASPEDRGEKGRITKDLILKYVQDLPKKLWYVCGPPPMTAAMRRILTELTVPEEQWRIEAWEIPGKSG